MVIYMDLVFIASSSGKWRLKIKNNWGWKLPGK